MSLTAFCSAKTLVLASVNSEITIITSSLIGTEWKGKKIPIYRFYQDPEDAKIFWVIRQQGDEPVKIIAERILYNGLGGSSANIAHHLRAMGMRDVTVAGFINLDPQDPAVIRDNAGMVVRDQLASRGIKFVPWRSDRTARTLVCLDAMDGKSTPLMEKPRGMEIPGESQRWLLDQQWEVIVCSSLPPALGLLKFIAEIFKKNPKAIKSLIPSMALIQSEDRAIQRQFRDLLQLAKIFQVNDAEATRWLGVTVNGGLVMEPRKMVEQMMVAVPQTGRGSRKVVSIITLGGSGAAVIGSWRKADAFFQPATTELESRIIDQTGAGDALQAGFIRTVVEMRFSPLALRLAIRVGADMAGRIIRVAGGAADSGMTTNKLVRSTAKWEASIRASHPELIE